MNKKVLVGFVLASSVLLAAMAVKAQSSAYFQAVTNLNPIGYWPMHEIAAPAPGDIETNYGTLGYLGTGFYPDWGVTLNGNTIKRGVIAGALANDTDKAVNFTFGGSPGANYTNAVIVPHTSPLATLNPPFSVECWFFPTNTSSADIWAQCGFEGLNAGAYGAGSGNVGGIRLTWQSGTNTGFQVFNYFNSSTLNTEGFSGTVGGPPAAPLNNWYHLVVFCDASTNIGLYVNGTLAYSTNATTLYTPDFWSPFTIGTGRGGTRSIAGYIDEVAIYTNVISDISTHYNDGISGAAGVYFHDVTNDNPAIYLRMDAATTYTAPAVGTWPVLNNFGVTNGVAVGNGVYTPGTAPGIVTGPFGSGNVPFSGLAAAAGTNVAQFSSMGTYADVGSVAAYNPTGAVPFTVAAMFRGNPCDNRFQNIVGHSDYSWRIAMNTNGKLQATVGANSGASVNSSGVYNDGNWHQVVDVYAPASVPTVTGTNSLYVDGVLDTSISTVNTNGIGPGTNQDALIAADPQYTNNPAGAGRLFSGQVCEVALFNSALSATQIRSLYDTAGEIAPAVIIVQPAAATVGIQATTNVFTVGATGTDPLAYKWYYNSSSNYTGATAITDGVTGSGSGLFGSATASLTLTNIQPTDAGFYYVVVTNNYGSVTSILSQFSVLGIPIITSQLPNLPFNLFVSQNSVLSVAVTGAPTFAYQWFTNGVADTTSGTNPVYLLSNVQLAMSGFTYQCIITNPVGSATNTLRTLTVLNYPASLTNSAYGSNILALSPQGYWPMHEVAAAAPGDVETNLGSLGALANGYYSDWTLPNQSVTHQVPGALANDSDPGVQFNGNGVNGNGGAGYLLVPRTLPTGLTASFTVEAWVKPANTNMASIVSQYGYGVNAADAGNNYGFFLMWGAGGKFQTGFGKGTAAGTNGITGNPHPPGQWYHVVATYDGSSLSLYENGNFETAQTIASSIDSAIPLTIGSGFWSATGPTNGFTGPMDEVAVYTNVIADIGTHYNDGISGAAGAYFHDVTNDNPILYYRMHAPAYVQPPVSAWPGMTNYGKVGINGVYSPGSMPGAVAGPSVGGKAVANLSGANVMPGNGMSSYADTLINPSVNPTFNPTNYMSFSYTAWFKSNPGDSRSFQMLMSAFNDTTWRCSINNAGKLQAHGAGADITSTVAYNDGNWHQFVVTAQGVLTNGTLGVFTNILYVDGASVGTAVSTTNTPVASPPDIMIGNDPGFTNNPLGPGRSLAGSVCEAAFFSGTVLTPAQVQALYFSAGVVPTITAQPTTGRSFVGGPGSNVIFGVIVAGSQPLSYQWYFNSSSNYSGATLLANGTKYANVTSSQVSTNVENMTVSNLVASDNGYYFVVITNSYGSITSSLASLTVFTGPVILSYTPVAYTNVMSLFAGASPIFSVSTTGEAPLSYYWCTNGVFVGGATNAAFIFPNLQSISPTNFDCIVSNSFGTVTSIVWTATVLTDPVAPFPQAVLALQPISYWRLNETPDDGSGNQGVIANDYMGGNNGIYTNVNLAQLGYNAGTDPTETSTLFGETGISFTNSYAGQIQGVDFGAPAGTTTNFTVQCWAQGIEAQPFPASILKKGIYSLNDEFTFDFASTAGHPYRFYIRAVTGGVINCTTTRASDSGVWHFLVGVCDETHGVVSFYIDGALAVSTPVGTTAGIAGIPTFPMQIGSAINTTPGIGYGVQFYGYVNDVAVFNYALTAAQVAGEFSASGSAPLITQQPVASTNVSMGGTLVVPVGVIGTAPIAYQWYNATGPVKVTGQTNTTLVVSNISASASYYLAATNAYGGTNTTTIAVNVVSGPPQIFADLAPTNWTAYAGGQVTYSITAFGTVPLYYQWYLNGAAISAATNSSYTVTVLLGTNNYSCSISNAFAGGSITNSSTATVVGLSSPTDPYSLSVLSNSPIAYWRLDETNGTIAYDYIGNHDATYTNVFLGTNGYNVSDPDLAAGFGVLASSDSYAGEINNSGNGIPKINFSGTGDAEFSVEAWAKGAASQVSGAGIVSKGYPGAEQFVLQVLSGDFTFYLRDGVASIISCASTIPPDGNWHHLVGVCDQGGGLAHLYVDGADVADSIIQPGKGVINPGGATLPAGNLVSIGSRVASASATTMADQFKGTIDEVAIYNHALTAAQVLAHYQAGIENVTPSISVTRSGNNVTFTYVGTLLSSTNVTGPYSTVGGASSPYTTPATNAQQFYRASNP